jgi:phosphoenolpyruvate carboxylase
MCYRQCDTHEQTDGSPTLYCIQALCSCAHALNFTILRFALPAMQSVEIVLTAHPTQVNRRTLQYKHSKIAALLQQHDRCAEDKKHTRLQQQRSSVMHAADEWEKPHRSRSPVQQQGTWQIATAACHS